jgi:oligoendopeptidase F
VSTFVPAKFDGANWGEIEPLASALLKRPVNSSAQFEAWLLDRSEFDAACGESRANLYINMTCHTDDESASGAWSRYIEEVPPRLRPMSFELDKRQAALAERFKLDPDRYMVLNRATKADVELFRPENVPLMTEQDRLTQQYQQITGKMTVEFDGREHTLPQMGRYLQETDRSVRERAWRAVSDRRMRDKDAIDDIYDKLIAIREKIARNAGFANFMDYSFKAMKRFDYTPRHCEAFHEAVAKHVVPLVRRLDERRRKSLKVDALRPWDLSVDEMGREPLTPFADGDELLRLSRRVFDRMGGGLGEMFAELGENGTPGECLDLDSRKGKAPGGYQYMRDRSRRPFIFMNAAGLHRDVETMLHEAGHAFHSQLSRHEPLVAYRESPIEFAEVASMSMELLSMTEWGEFYPRESDLVRAKRLQLEDHTIMILPWIAQIDAFQHWLYTHPGHTRAQRNAEWLRLDERFGHALSWQGLEDARAWQWQRQLHLFIHPFYYIEYGIARLGSMGLWLTSLEKGRDTALALYKRGLSLGGSRPLPELFGAAGLPFDFGPETVKRLVDAVVEELNALES